MGRNLTRRDVLRGSAASLAAIFVGAAEAAGHRDPGTEAEAIGGFEPKPPPKSGRLRFGIIGSGGKGWSGMELAAEHGPIVAVCDVDVENLAKSVLHYPDAVAFSDYRTMLRAMHTELDAVVISTPDHHHSIASAMAMNYGLHTYCEKPLTRTISEARALQKIARAKKVATQMGNQSTAQTAMRKTARLIKGGVFGKVKEVHLWTDRAGGWWKQGVPRPEPAPRPDKLNYPIWLGPRPYRPFAPGYHPFHWRGWWDFGTGSLGDMGCHIFNMPFMALDLRDPIAVQARTSGHNRDSFPEWAIVNYEFGARGGRAPLVLTWYDGGKRPDASLAPGFELDGNGVIVVCENATIYGPSADNDVFHLVGGGTMPEVESDESPGHMAEFARAALGGPPAVSNIPDYAGPLTETVLLGNLAIWADGPRVDWDAKRMKVKGTDEFDSLIFPTFADGWGI